MLEDAHLKNHHDKHQGHPAILIWRIILVKCQAHSVVETQKGATDTEKAGETLVAATHGNRAEVLPQALQPAVPWAGYAIGWVEMVDGTIRFLWDCSEWATIFQREHKGMKGSIASSNNSIQARKQAAFH